MSTKVTAPQEDLADRRFDNKGDVVRSFDPTEFPLPHHKAEIWRFFPLRSVPGITQGTLDVSGKQPAQLAVEINGTDQVLTDVTVEHVKTNDPRIGEAGAPIDRIGAYAFSQVNEPTIITVGHNAVIGHNDDPLIIALTGPGAGLSAVGHIQLRVDDDADAVVVLDHRGSGTIGGNIEYVVGDRASLAIVSIQDCNDDAVEFVGHHAVLGQRAKLQHSLVTLGGNVLRTTVSVRYRGEGAEAEMLGAYFADDGQYFEHRLLVDHSVPHCKSRVSYKGALQGDANSPLPDAHTVWVGDVLIRAEADGTDTYEINRNLILTDGARADSIPNLEIENGDIIGAGHASAIGRFDENQLFYLRSRGLTEETARRLVVRGFFREIIQRISVKSVRDRLDEEFEHELEIVGM